MGRSVTLYFVRHGETDWNAEHRLQGQIDTSLNAKGRAQAARNGRVLSEVLSDPRALQFISSPLSRARETMKIVRTELGLEPDGFSTDDRLKEINFGAWEGWSWAELPQRDPAGYAARQADEFSWRPVGGESYSDLMMRVALWFDSLTGDAVVVSHGGVSRVLRGYLLGIEPAKVPSLGVPQDKVLVLRRDQMCWH
jgi:broad specificity phosphatase PhoE